MADNFFIISEEHLRNLIKSKDDLRGAGLFSWLKDKAHNISKKIFKRPAKKVAPKQKKRPEWDNMWDYLHRGVGYWNLDDSGFPEDVEDWRGIYLKLIKKKPYSRAFIKEFQGDFHDRMWGQLNEQDAFEVYTEVYKDEHIKNVDEFLERMDEGELRI